MIKTLPLRVLVSVNDGQYYTTVNDTLNTYDLSNVQLYLGGLPVTDSLVSGLYPSLTKVSTFSGCIRNVLSNGYYLDMSTALVSVNSYYDDLLDTDSVCEFDNELNSEDEEQNKDLSKREHGE
ncbi:unnamed protein product, partial [Rotaria sp. Silwood1]